MQKTLQDTGWQTKGFFNGLIYSLDSRLQFIISFIHVFSDDKFTKYIHFESGRPKADIFSHFLIDPCSNRLFQFMYLMRVFYLKNTLTISMKVISPRSAPADHIFMAY